MKLITLLPKYPILTTSASLTRSVFDIFEKIWRKKRFLAAQRLAALEILARRQIVGEIAGGWHQDFMDSVTQKIIIAGVLSEVAILKKPSRLP